MPQGGRGAAKEECRGLRSAVNISKAKSKGSETEKSTAEKAQCEDSRGHSAGSSDSENHRGHSTGINNAGWKGKA